MTKRWWLRLLGSIVAAVVIAGLTVGAVQSSRSHNDQEAWRCITHADVHVLLTVHSGPTTLRLYSLVRMDATLRYLAR